MTTRSEKPRPGASLWPFLAGLVAGAAGAVVLQAVRARRGLDPQLVRLAPGRDRALPVVVVPGILGSQLIGEDGRESWLSMRNALGHHDLSLPFRLPFEESRDGLRPGGLIGVDELLPRVFGFTEYADLLSLLDDAGFRRDAAPDLERSYHVFTYDWRRDLVETARLLDTQLESLAQAARDPDARFNVIGHSMGGLLARYYLRYGTAEPAPDRPVTWAGARRIKNLILVATPNAGSIGALEAILNGSRVGLSYTTLAASVIARMPSIYQLLPPSGTRPLVGKAGTPLELDLHDLSTWKQLGWGPFRPFPARRRGEEAETPPARVGHEEFLAAALARARALQDALGRRTEAPCPSRVVLLGGDCLPTPARAFVSGPPGLLPRFEPRTRAEAEVMLEAGDGRVTRASALASHLPGAEESETGSPLPEVAQAVFGDAEHHGIYAQPTFQSVLLRLLLRPPPHLLRKLA